MNEPWIAVLTVALVGLGILAELNLLRIFLSDWRAGRRADRARPMQTRHRANERRADLARGRVRFRGVAACIAAPAVLSPLAHAQQAAVSEPPSTAAPAPAAPKAPSEDAGSAFSVQLNFDYTTAYFYHGILQEDTGVILQPAARLTVNVYEKDEFKVDVYLATWNSFHSQATGALTNGDFTEYWYESDLIGGFTITSGKLSLSTQYVFLTSPSDAFETVQELDFTLTYDDSELFGKFALHPYALLAIETGADASDGADSDTGTYLELGIAPGFSFDVGKTKVGLTFPASIGLSLHDYYQNAAGEDDTFGFVQVGVKASIPLPIAARYGIWTLNAGLAGMYLGEQTASYNHGDHDQLIGTLGVQVNF